MSYIKVELEDLKYSSDRGDVSICQACLSSDRVLRVIDEHLDIYMTICDPYNMLTKQILVCWECDAVLKKIKSFQAQVKEAQKMLDFFYSNKHKHTSINTLSTLGKADITYTDNSQAIICTIEPKQQVEIKKENPESDNVIDNLHIEIDEIKPDINKNEDLTAETFSDDDEYVKSEDDETFKQVKKKEKKRLRRRKKPQHYKIVYGDNVTEKSLLIKKFELQPHEIENMREKKEYSKYFKSSQSVYYAYECTLCGLQFYTVPRINTHMKDHIAIKCVYCEVILPDKMASVYEHVKLKHEYFICDHCGKNCKSLFLIEKHMISAHMSHICSICHITVRTRRDLHKHKNLRHSGARPENCFCVPCGKQFVNESCYRYHIKHSLAHASERKEPTAHISHTCFICHKILRSRLHLYKHKVKWHDRVRPENCYCAPCGKQFKNEETYRRHVRYSVAHATDWNQPAYHMYRTCSICNIKFPTRKKLYRHKEKKHGAHPENCYCAPCGKQFANSERYRHHLLHSLAHASERRQPHDKKVVPCTKCDKVFTRSCYMMNHYRFVHENTSRHVCSLCNRPFLNGTKLSNHVKYYHEKREKVRDKYCEVCGKAFHSNTLLKIHMATHTGEKPHKCEHCLVTFTTKTKLTAHIQSDHKGV